MENYRLQMKNTEAENLLLKQQIHPHFLFNSLNTMKLLYKTNPEKGEHYLMQLSDFLRVVLSHNKKFTATLDEELTICKNYLEMQKMRFGESLQWELLIENKDKLKSYVPSFSLQPLLENAIKHNCFTKQAPLKITIHQYDDCIKVSNNVNQNQYPECSTGSGLTNLAERYQLLTGKEIRIKKNEKQFSVSFKMIENESSYN
jgi:LytS/YehU family sensor histidine kinase